MIVTLLTDFGDVDGFVDAMRGRVLSAAPEAHLVDLAELEGPAVSYSEVDIGAPITLIGSEGTVECAVRERSATRQFALEVGEPVHVRKIT
ncbi:MAG: SAM-dependent chlorinase/fluorinase [Bradymonadia bacterium]